MSKHVVGVVWTSDFTLNKFPACTAACSAQFCYLYLKDDCLVFAGYSLALLLLLSLLIACYI